MGGHDSWAGMVMRSWGGCMRGRRRRGGATLCLAKRIAEEGGM